MYSALENGTNEKCPDSLKHFFPSCPAEDWTRFDLICAYIITDILGYTNGNLTGDYWSCVTDLQYNIEKNACWDQEFYTAVACASMLGDFDIPTSH